MQDGITNRGWPKEDDELRQFWPPNMNGINYTDNSTVTYADINKPEVNIKNARKQALANTFGIWKERDLSDIFPKYQEADPSYYQPDLKIELKVDPNNATRFDTGKADWSQVPFSALEGMVKVLEFGAKKYAKANWVSGGGFDHSRVLNSCMRHLFAYAEGQDVDPESGLSHIWHAQCNMLFLAHYKNHPEKFPKDDRIKFISEQ